MNPSISKSIRRQNEKRVKKQFATGSQARPMASSAGTGRSSGT